MTSAVTVIVNASGAVQTVATISGEAPVGKITEQEVSFINLLSQNNRIEIKAEEYPVITNTMLMNLYESGKTMIIKGDNYTMVLEGKDIVNCNNQLVTGLTITKTAKGLELILNDNQNLPGALTFQVDNGNQYNYMYLYNTGKDKYENIKVDNLSNIKIDTVGKYLLTEKKLNGISVSLFVVIGFVIVVTGLTGVYIAVKKKHWFW